MTDEHDARSNYDKIFGEHAPGSTQQMQVPQERQGQLFDKATSPLSSQATSQADEQTTDQAASPGMYMLMSDVRAFMQAGGQDTPKTLGLPHPAVRDLRVALIDEEVNQELLPALAADNLVDIADACADAIVVILGTALAYGIPLARVWGEVDRSNRAKIDPVTGRVLKREDGKLLKPPGWVPPDIHGALGLAPSAKLINGDAP